MAKSKKNLNVPATTEEWAERTISTIKEQVERLDEVSVQVLGDALTLIDGISVNEDRTGNGPIYTKDAVIDAVTKLNDGSQDTLMKLTLALNSSLVVGLYDDTISYIGESLKNAQEPHVDGKQGYEEDNGDESE